MSDERDRVAAAMRAINDAWLAGRIDDLAPLLHDNITMVFPAFAGRMQGRAPLLAGFQDFSANAKVHHFHEGTHEIDVAGKCAVVTFNYEMIYERASAKYRVTGRDLWVFENDGAQWRAAWRTMLDLQEEAVGDS